MTRKPVPAEQACGLLGIDPRTLRRWVKAGAPVARRGRQGRGNQQLYDVPALEAWKRSQGGENALTVLAAELPELLAEVVYECFVLADGSHKRPSAGLLAATWFLSVLEILDRIREQVPHVADLEHVPEKVEWLRKIERGDFVHIRRESFEWQLPMQKIQNR